MAEFDYNFEEKQRHTVADLQEALWPLYRKPHYTDLAGNPLPDIVDVLYFIDLYRPDPRYPNDERLMSAYIGATAYGRDEERSHALDALGNIGDTHDEDSYTARLIRNLDEAIRIERQYDNLERIKRFETAHAELGKPLLLRAGNKLVSRVLYLYG